MSSLAEALRGVRVVEKNYWGRVRSKEKKPPQRAKYRRGQPPKFRPLTRLERIHRP